MQEGVEDHQEWEAVDNRRAVAVEFQPQDLFDKQDHSVLCFQWIESTVAESRCPIVRVLWNRSGHFELGFEFGTVWWNWSESEVCQIQLDNRVWQIQLGSWAEQILLGNLALQIHLDMGRTTLVNIFHPQLRLWIRFWLAKEQHFEESPTDF